MSINIEDMFKQLDVSLTLVNSKLKERSSDLQRLDMTQAEFYHLFENGNLPDTAVKEVFKEFKACLLERREVKLELAKLQSLDALLKQKGLGTNVSNKDKGCGTYKPKYITHLFKKYKKYIDYDIDLQD